MLSSPFVRTSVVLLAAFALAPSAATGQSPSVLSLLPTEGRSIEVGNAPSGALSTSDHLSANDSYLEAWELRGSSGSSITLDLESDDFDPILYVVGPGLGETLRDDDGGGGCNARLTFTFLESGTFRVVASSLGSRETGTYTLTASEQPGEAPTYGCGEANPEELMALPTDGRTLTMGMQQTSQLDVLAPTVEDGRPAQAWSYQGTPGEPVSIILESEAFDAFLYVVGPGLDMTLTDDDSGGELNARIDFTPLSTEPYLVVASALSPGVTGTYTIRTETPPDLAELPTDGRTIDLGQTTQGFLSATEPIVADGRPGQAWAFEGGAGVSLTIDLVSDDFDAYLYLAGPGLQQPLSDDDGGGDLNSRISVTLPQSGTYRIIVSALTSGVSGSYTLRVNAPME